MASVRSSVRGFEWATVGPNNKLEPGPVDQGQPTHFQTGRQWGVFVVKVPKDFGTRAITWTITSNGETQSIPLTLNRNYPIEPFEEKGMGNKPPVLTFGGSEFTGPPTAVAAAFTGAVDQPVVLTLVRERSQADQAGLRGPRRARCRHRGDRVVPQVPRAWRREVRSGAASPPRRKARR